MTSEARNHEPSLVSRVLAWAQTERGLIILAILVGFVLRILAQPLSAYIGDDSDDYGAFARGLLLLFSGGEWRDTPAESGGYGYSPAYPLVTALLSYVTGSIWVAARVISLMAGLAIIYATYVFGRDLFGSKVGLIAGWITAVSSVLVGQSSRTATETMFVLLVLIALIAVLRYQRGDSFIALKSASMWTVGVALGIAAMTRPEGFVIAAVVVVFLVWQSRRVTESIPLVIPGLLMTIIWAWSGFLEYFVDHYRGVNSAVDAGLSVTQFGVQLGSQSFHVATGNLTALGLVAMVLTVIGVWFAGKQRHLRDIISLPLSIPVFVGLFLIVTPGLGDMNRYIAVMVPIWAVFAGYGVVSSIKLLATDVFSSSPARWVLVTAMVLVVASVFNAKAIGERSLTWDAVATAQMTTLDWIDAHAVDDGVKILDLAGISQVRFTDDPESYEFVTSLAVELSELATGYEFVVVQQPVGDRYVLSDQYVATVEITANQGRYAPLIYTVYSPYDANNAVEVVQIETERIETLWDRFWSID